MDQYFFTAEEELESGRFSGKKYLVSIQICTKIAQNTPTPHFFFQFANFFLHYSRHPPNFFKCANFYSRYSPRSIMFLIL